MAEHSLEELSSALEQYYEDFPSSDTLRASYGEVKSSLDRVMRQGPDGRREGKLDPDLSNPLRSAVGNLQQTMAPMASLLRTCNTIVDQLEKLKPSTKGPRSEQVGVDELEPPSDCFGLGVKDALTKLAQDRDRRPAPLLHAVVKLNDAVI